MGNRGFANFVLIIAVTVALAVVVFIFFRKEQSPQQLKEEVVPITFKVDALEADEVELVFPLFWAEYRMEPVRMEKRGGMFETTVNLPQHSLITYQYLWSGKPSEYREQFRKEFEVNRMIHVVSPVTVTDKVYSWGPQEVARPVKLSGKVSDRQTGQSILDVIIVVDGIITLTDGDGFYEVDTRGGQHQIIAYLLDGSYKTQSKVVNLEQGEVNFELEKANPVSVTIKVDANPPPFHKVRVYSTAEQTGPRFLFNNRFITESYKTIGNGKIALNLYEDQYVDYLYSVGSPQIGYESKDGQHVIRHFIAKNGLVISDNVSDFVGKNSITLNVKVPDYTDPKDIIGVGTLHPTLLYMHPKGGNVWTLTLSSSENMQGQKYRYFKSFGGDGDEETQERTITAKVMNDKVSSWKHQDSKITQTAVSVPTIKNKFDIFAYTYDYYDSTIAMLMESEIARISQKGFHGLVLSQIWAYEALEPKIKIVPTTSANTLYTPFFELKRLSKLAHDKQLKVTLYPQLGGAESVLANPRVFDEKWWNIWLSEIEKFNMYNARTAQEATVDYLLLQTRQPGLEMPGGYRQTYNQRLREIIAKMRTVYKGKIIVQTEDDMDYWKDGDIISQKIWDSLGLGKDAPQQEIDLAVANLLDTKYKPLSEKSGKPFLTDQLAYESTDGAVNGAQVPENDGPNTDNNHKYPLDIEEQRMIHEAFYKAINERSWIAGVNLFAYGFTDKPLAREIDIRGKPAEDLASAWARAIGKR